MALSIRRLPMLAALAAGTVTAPLFAQTSLPSLRRTVEHRHSGLQLTLDRPSYILFVVRNPDGSWETTNTDSLVASLPAGNHFLAVPYRANLSATPLPAAHFGNCWDLRPNGDGTMTQVWNSNCGLFDTPTALAAGWAPITSPTLGLPSRSLMAVDLGAAVRLATVDELLDRLHAPVSAQELLSALAKGLGLRLGELRWTATSF